MILQIDLNGEKIVNTFSNTVQVNEYFEKLIHNNLSKLLNRRGDRWQVEGFLWAKVDDKDKSIEEIEQEALEQVQDLVLRSTLKSIDLRTLSSEKVKSLILILKS